ncbi:PepSY domain-containing protein [Stenotrophomonas sp. JAI102]|uniref:PepSY domain-containing protein n=1 Tax=Stenotrophomonas sp. JAI102 TaxID=2723077 RepID=UPI0027B956C7|nr:PepSY domain-containing protein [Stenotrophomonas sp. JAI102]
MRVLDGGSRQQDGVRQAVRQGRFVPLEQVVADALRRYPGKLIEVELDDGKYEIEILGADGVVMELDYDAATGRLLKMEKD